MYHHSLDITSERQTIYLLGILGVLKADDFVKKRAEQIWLFVLTLGNYFLADEEPKRYQ